MLEINQKRKRICSILIYFQRRADTQFYTENKSVPLMINADLISEKIRRNMLYAEIKPDIKSEFKSEE